MLRTIWKMLLVWIGLVYMAVLIMLLVYVSIGFSTVAQGEVDLHSGLL